MQRPPGNDIPVECAAGHVLVEGTRGPLTLEFDRATRPFVRIDRRHLTPLKIDRDFSKIAILGTLPL